MIVDVTICSAWLFSLFKDNSDCVCFQEAKAIIAQRSGNPREFFKQKERAMTISVDTSPVSVHRAGKHFTACLFTEVCCVFICETETLLLIIRLGGKV